MEDTLLIYEAGQESSTDIFRYPLSEVISFQGTLDIAMVMRNVLSYYLGSILEDGLKRLLGSI